MESEDIRRHIERLVKQRSAERYPQRQAEFSRKSQDLVSRGLTGSTLSMAAVFWDQIGEGKALINDYIEVGVESFWKALGCVPACERDWLLAKCDEVASNWPSQPVSNLLEGAQMLATYQKHLPPGRVGRERLEILISEKELNEKQERRQAQTAAEVDRRREQVSTEPLRIHVDDIDSFAQVRHVPPGGVSQLLQDGRIDVAEEAVKEALAAVLNVPFTTSDHGGELADLYTANLVFRGIRTTTAFLLKGHGTSGLLTLRKCGHDGGQVVRLFDMAAALFVVQYVGPVDEDLIRDVDQKTDRLRLQGKRAWYCIIDGQDTARLLRACGRI